jgi:hypothetical protein
VAKHLWLVVTCKTPKCGNLCAIKYHGTDIGAIEIAEMVPTGFSYQCGLCHRTHRYEIEETRIEHLDVAPPPGWTNPF